MKWFLLAKEYGNQKKFAIEIAQEFLITYFKYSKDTAEDMIVVFAKNFKTQLDNDYMVFNDGAFFLAGMIHYTSLYKTIEGFSEWRFTDETYQKFGREANWKFFHFVARTELFENRYD